ncbi:hypothetical protein FAES_2192 [Fibrella aestuarina BUZ 2]|uniref:Outer membrane protein beta-barrel domain-containing protein n=1 Tax=Fibrella aestuarina BUZ 2 TaxID=1166018 RepID=I0K7U8_9BACT|nr:hypothetical protein [Fibrella aestuarina]CCH00201.1 hypothetical protein FAES_2192 [Fibrella aestuarina BUZ 2]
MKHLCLLICCLLVVVTGYAQGPYLRAKNVIQLGPDYLGIDPANGLKYRYAFEYRRYVARDRVSIGATVGFMSSQRQTVLVPDLVSVGANSRRRATIDLTTSYNLLQAIHHTLRLGVGPSIWYLRDDLFDKVDPYPIPGGTEPLVKRRHSEGWNIGAHGLIEYTYALSLDTQVSLHTGAAYVGPSGLAPLFGLRAGYRF